MPALTAETIRDQELETAAHFTDLAQKARKSGDPLTADDHQYVADMATTQAARAELAMQI